eukprot:3423717-Rhodomonas_salina.1
MAYPHYLSAAHSPQHTMCYASSTQRVGTAHRDAPYAMPVRHVTCARDEYDVEEGGRVLAAYARSVPHTA